MGYIEKLLGPAIHYINGLLWNQVLVYLLLGVGIYFTFRLGFIQLCALPHSIRILKRSGSGAGTGISGFQAFATGLAGRVGSGNIVGVAIALSAGGPGAIFWMWVTALLGMASAFVEATLAQIFKVPVPGKQYFQGGPAYYMRIGLGLPVLGMIFAVALIFTFGLAFNALQSNFIADAFFHAFAIPKEIIGIVLTLSTAPLIFGGVQRVMRLAQLIVPVMALAYILLVGYIVIVNFEGIPDMFTLIFRSAFGLEQAVWGIAGYTVSQALTMGIRRGLYSNEAGMGGAPNAAAAATTSHPVTQGLLQMLGVFIDTIVICTATAVMILLSGQYLPGSGMEGAVLTQRAVTSQVGPLGNGILAIIIFLFSFSTLIGNYAFTEGNIRFLSRHPLTMLVFRISFLFMVLFGSIMSLPLILDMADLSMALMALVNLIAITLLVRYAILAWEDYKKQRQQGIKVPKFRRDSIPELSNKLPDNVW